VESEGHEEKCRAVIDGATLLTNRLAKVLDVGVLLMDCITFLQKIMAQHPIPVIVCSSLTEEGSDM
jgi:DNA-binding response OmpR family regulator